MVFRIFRKTDRSEPARPLGVAEAVAYLTAFKRDVEGLIDNLEFTKEPGEMLPPWIMRIHPQVLPGVEALDRHSPVFGDDYWYWRGGDGGSYRSRFMTCFLALDLERRKDYFAKYDLGPDWQERRHWAMELFDPDELGMSEAECDALIEDILARRQG